MVATFLSNRRVAILEDNVTNRERWSSMVTFCGGIAVPIQTRAPQLRELDSFFRNENINLLLSDHHLHQQTDYASYNGAEAIATGYQHGVGGILVTAFERDDAELSLRQHRRWIPALIHSTELNSKNLIAGLHQADREVREHTLSRERVPHRSIMTVKRIERRNAHNIVKVVLSQWNISQEIGFPLEMIPKFLQSSVIPGSLLIAQVNIEASRPEDLYFDKFETPDPDVIERAKSLFSRS